MNVTGKLESRNISILTIMQKVESSIAIAINSND